MDIGICTNKSSVCIFVTYKIYALENILPIAWHLASAMLLLISLTDSVTVAQSDLTDALDAAVLWMSFIRYKVCKLGCLVVLLYVFCFPLQVHS